jgi:hypothetical protein
MKFGLSPKFDHKWRMREDRAQRNIFEPSSEVASSSGIVIGYGLEGRVSNPDRDKTFLFSTSRPALGPTHPPI